MTGGSEEAGWGVLDQGIRDIKWHKIMKSFESEQLDFELDSGQNW